MRAAHDGLTVYPAVGGKGTLAKRSDPHHAIQGPAVPDP